MKDFCKAPQSSLRVNDICNRDVSFFKPCNQQLSYHAVHMNISQQTMLMMSGSKLFQLKDFFYYRKHCVTALFIFWKFACMHNILHPSATFSRVT